MEKSIGRLGESRKSPEDPQITNLRMVNNAIENNLVRPFSSAEKNTLSEKAQLLANNSYFKGLQEYIIPRKPNKIIDEYDRLFALYEDIESQVAIHVLNSLAQRKTTESLKIYLDVVDRIDFFLKNKNLTHLTDIKGRIHEIIFAFCLTNSLRREKKKVRLWAANNEEDKKGIDFHLKDKSGLGIDIPIQFKSVDTSNINLLKIEYFFTNSRDVMLLQLEKVQIMNYLRDQYHGEMHRNKFQLISKKILDYENYLSVLLDEENFSKKALNREQLQKIMLEESISEKDLVYFKKDFTKQSHVNQKKLHSYYVMECFAKKFFEKPSAKLMENVDKIRPYLE